VATLDLQIHNQRDETVMRCDFSLLVRKVRLIVTDTQQTAPRAEEENA
jgi:hypothetical protein